MSKPVPLANKVIRKETPNSLAFKYVFPGRTMGSKVVTVKSREGALRQSVLANELMILDAPRPTAPGPLPLGVVQRVVIGTDEDADTAGRDYVTVTVRDHAAWAKWGKDIESRITAFAGRPNAVLANPAEMESEKDFLTLVETFAKTNPNNIAEIKAVIALVNRKLASHGGETHFVDFNKATGTLKVWMSGNCSGCAASSMTIQTGLMGRFNSLANDLETPVKKIELVAQKPAGLRL